MKGVNSYPRTKRMQCERPLREFFKRRKQMAVVQINDRKTRREKK